MSVIQRVIKVSVHLLSIAKDIAKEVEANERARNQLQGKTKSVRTKTGSKHH